MRKSSTLTMDPTPAPDPAPEPLAAPAPPPRELTEAELAALPQPVPDTYGARLRDELTAAMHALPPAADATADRRAVWTMQLERARDLAKHGTPREVPNAQAAVESLQKSLAELGPTDEQGRRDGLVALVARSGEVRDVRGRLLAEIQPLSEASMRHGCSMDEGRRLDRLRGTLSDLNNIDVALMRARSELEQLIPGHGLETLATLERVGMKLREAAAAGRESVVRRVRALLDELASEEKTLRALARTATWAELSEALEKYR
jgi:hypothetical protein